MSDFGMIVYPDLCVPPAVSIRDVAGATVCSVPADAVCYLAHAAIARHLALPPPPLPVHVTCTRFKKRILADHPN